MRRDPRGPRFVARPDKQRDALTTACVGYLRDLVEEDGFGVTREYVGCTSQERADEVRRAFKRAARVLDVSVKALWHEHDDCTSDVCGNDEDECAFHVEFACWDRQTAARYMARRRASWSASGIV